MTRNNRRRFTLIEVVVVMMILVSLAAIATPLYMKYLDDSHVSTAKIQIKALSQAVQDYKIALGSYPDSLDALITDPGVDGWKGPYFDATVLPGDPWGQPYVYTLRDDALGFDIMSYGSDKLEGGEGNAADISNH